MSKRDREQDVERGSKRETGSKRAREREKEGGEKKSCEMISSLPTFHKIIKRT